MRSYIRSYIRKSRCVLFAVLLTAIFLAAGCGSEKESENAYQVYYLNNEVTGIEAVNRSLDTKSENPAEIAAALLKVLATEPETAGLRRTLNEETSSPVITINKEQINLNFPEIYNAYSTAEEVLVRAAVVRTLTQVEGISSVCFLVKGEPLLTQNTKEEIGAMFPEDFVENAGEQISKSMEATITLYFSNAEGNGLVRRYRTVHYTSNESLEKTVVKQLLKGPTDTSLKSTIPSSANIISVTVVDRVCYVNMDDAFRNDQNSDVNESVVLYSIVNSLTELSTVDKVQISVNGDTSGKVRYNLNLNTMYEWDDSLLEETETEETEEISGGE